MIPLSCIAAFLGDVPTLVWRWGNAAHRKTGKLLHNPVISLPALLQRHPAMQLFSSDIFGYSGRDDDDPHIDYCYPGWIRWGVLVGVGILGTAFWAGVAELVIHIIHLKR